MSSDRDWLIEQLREIDAGYREGWDRDPMLVLLLQSGPVPTPVFDLPIAHDFERPPDFLDAFSRLVAASTSSLYSALFPPDHAAVGWAFAHEGWMLEQSADDPEDVETAMRQARAHELHRHPNRIEAKMIEGVTRRTSPCLLVRRRDGDVSVADGVDGYITESLQRLAGALA